MLLKRVKPLLLSSIKYAVIPPGVPLKLAAGLKRNAVSATKYKTRLEGDGMGMSNQLLPPWYCQTPSAALDATLVMPMPIKDLAKAPSLASLKLAPNKLPTVAPLFVTGSSCIDGSVTDELSTVGLSFTALTSALTCTAVLDERPVVSTTLTVNAFRPLPLTSCAAFHCSFSVGAKVVPAATSAQSLPLHFCKVPVLTDSMRNLIVSPVSTSFSSAASTKSW